MEVGRIGMNSHGKNISQMMLRDYISGKRNQFVFLRFDSLSMDCWGEHYCQKQIWNQHSTHGERDEPKWASKG
jgi:hypothetical protein